MTYGKIVLLHSISEEEFTVSATAKIKINPELAILYGIVVLEEDVKSESR